MSKLRVALLKSFNYIGDHSGCHQIPERCFCVRGYIFPLCARCTGVALGQIAAVVLLLCGVYLNMFLCITLLALMGLDWFVQYMGWLESNNIRRFITGLMGGLGLFQICFHIAKQIFILLFV